MNARAGDALAGNATVNHVAGGRLRRIVVESVAADVGVESVAQDALLAVVGLVEEHGIDTVVSKRVR